MNTPALRFRSGVALVITLCFLVLISVSIVAFLVRAQLQHKLTFSSVSQKKAELLALSATNVILSELREEMAHGSHIYQSDGKEVADLTAATPPLIFQPSDRRNAVPERRGVNPAGVSNLVKSSYPTASDPKTSLALYSGGRPLVADSASADTSVPSRNGRLVDDEVWRTPRLVPDGGEPLQTRWCIMTRQGARSVSDADLACLSDQRNPGYAIGRFAFNLYEVGGLLDINMAGNALEPAANANRAFLNQADLSQVLGIISGDSPVARFLNWRSPLSQRDPNSLFATSNSVRSVRFGEQRFTSRQDLIHYAESKPDIIAADVLPSLTVFSRELNAPSWFPNQNATDMGAATNGGSNVYAYKDNQNTSLPVNPHPNRFVANIRVPSDAGTLNLKTYHPDGTPCFYQVKPGEPLVQRRFPLGRLNWIGCNGPQNGGTEENIRACFGLCWNVSAKCWNYVGPAGTTPVEKLATLDQVASEKREPNFFELLQAGMLKGSLGLCSQGWPGEFPATSSEVEPEFANPVVQVLQIGANLIDQYDEDNFPTCVTFRLPAITSPPKPTARYDRRIVGSESLPMIYRIVSSAYRPVDFNRKFAKGWIEFELWNPYQERSNPTRNEPKSFRIRKNAGQFALLLYAYKDPDGPTGPASPVAAGGLAVPPVDYGALELNIPDNSISMSSIAKDPKLLNTLRQQSGLKVGSSLPDNVFTEEGESASYTGFFCGEVDLDHTAPETLDIDVLAITFYPLPAAFVLEYDYGGGDWRSVQDIRAQRSNVGIVKALDGRQIRTGLPNSGGMLTLPGRRYTSLIALDPRTLRFGYWTMAGGPIVTGAPGFVDHSERTPFWSISNKYEQRSCWEHPSGPCFYPNIGKITNTAVISVGAALFRYADNRGDGKTGGIATSFVPGNAQPMYTDVDGVQRYGDGFWNKDLTSLNPDSKDGVFPMLPIAQRPQDRPVILNRPFQNVGEMGFAFRDLPFKSLDFSTSRSGDAALLDLFCINEGDSETGVVAGRVNLNTTNSNALKAVLTGSTRTPALPAAAHLDATEAETLANALISLTSGTGTDDGPLTNPAELAQRLLDSSYLKNSPAVPNQIKSQKEVAVRSLAALGQTRTWNLMIDIVAQAGRYSKGSTKLSEFTVEGERHYWMHVAIDRYTGKVIDQILEPVTHY